MVSWYEKNAFISPAFVTMGDILSSVLRGVLWSSESIKEPIQFELLRDQQALLNTIDRKFKFHACLFSLVAFIILHIGFHFMFRCLCKRYRHFTEPTQAYWCGMLANVVFSVLVSPFALLIMIKDSYILSDIIHNTSFLSMLILCITIGFLVYQIIVQLTGHIIYNSYDKVLTVYDIINVAILGLLVYYDYAHFLGCAIVLTQNPVATYGFAQFDFIPEYIASCWCCLCRMILLHLYICSPLLGAYCLWTTVSQWDIIREEISLFLIHIVYTCVIVEVIILPELWTYSFTDITGVTIAKTIQHSQVYFTAHKHRHLSLHTSLSKCCEFVLSYPPFNRIFSNTKVTADQQKKVSFPMAILQSKVQEL